VFHLVRRVNGLAPLARFLASYRDRPGHLEHDLVFILKGFPGERIDRELADQMDSVRHTRMHVPDQGYDIGAYFAAARRFEHENLCFMNSFCEILAPGWLEALYRALCLPDAGAASATGSNQGFNPERRFIPDAERLSARSSWKHALLRIPLVERLMLFRRKLQFPPFPNPHLRTNAFMIRHAEMLALDLPRVFSKRQAYSFESGRSGMTAQLLKAGKRPYVVGRDGQAYAVADWVRSHTFWSRDQENLMVADNQTRRYQSASIAEKMVLCWDAWGLEGLRESGWTIDQERHERPRQ